MVMNNMSRDNLIKLLYKLARANEEFNNLYHYDYGFEDETNEELDFIYTNEFKHFEYLL